MYSYGNTQLPAIEGAPRGKRGGSPLQHLRPRTKAISPLASYTQLPERCIQYAGK